MKKIQEDFIRLVFPLPRYGANGIFGEETEDAVMAFPKRTVSALMELPDLETSNIKKS
ncbi:hypothetical protein [Thermaerobacillus caldiproteolyticus]|uniref:Peptidoglycan hydrolase-like protein with peptidoglycan-binding domain n=1 Tax=Thermaerobacillus caldiproteolyticus TaxID=247480 RepID=A0A7W0BZ77_9BACL|nr:hypothetical protein [Anoxybacillus caldiproteolyticus]MBA2876471.1 peptidoglycan hydrolase-like protein with peptidoglycan-binding domain [Anoxybacillus caldiproteolyticus]